MTAQKVRSDWLIFYIAIFLIMFGLLMVYSASSITQAENPLRHNSIYYAWRQTAWAAAAVVAFLIMRRWDYRKLCQAKFAFPALSVAIVMVLAAYVFGDAHHRWIRVGSVGFQPSEFAKPAMVVFLSYLLTRRGDINRAGNLLPTTIALGLLITAVILADLGTGFVLTVSAGVLLWMAGLARRYLAGVAVLAVTAIMLIILVTPYRFVRLVAFLGVEHPIVKLLDRDGVIREEMRKTRYGVDPNYQLNQSIIAVGSGGATGLGLGQGVQKIFYLPEAHTDFIFAVIAEELGLLGTLTILSAYGILLWRGLRLATLTEDPFGRYLALGITTLFVVQGFFNMSVVLGLAPTKGITLPLISYGGSSLLGSMLSLGILSSVSEHSAA